MNFSLTDEQEALREAAIDALSRVDFVGGAREALDGGPLPDVWSTAREAGWTGLLVPEEFGGAGLDPFDGMLVLEQCGRRLTGAGLIGHLGASLILAGSDHELLEQLATGEERAAVVWGVDFELDVPGADWLITREGLMAARDAEIEPVIRGDATRPLAHVRVPGAADIEPLQNADFDRALYVTQALLAADALGVTERMLEMSVDYAKERYAFGRKIGSYQAIKQQIVEILRHAGTARSLLFYAGYAAEARIDELPLAASAARFAAEEAADYGTRTCIAVHGGIGATWEHDAHLYWRRAQLSRLLLGGVGGAADRVAEEIIELAQKETV
jgi:alkylation response protein AidB-like acyl-CoA dehydrogenase